MPRIDAIDISHHNTIVHLPALAPTVKICVHKVNEGLAVDRRFLERIRPIMEQFEIFGGYTVLLPGDRPGGSTIKQQIDKYVATIAPFYRDGWITQLDVEPWEQYTRPPSADEILQASDLLARALGRRPLVYINPNQMPTQFKAWRAQSTDALWLPNYGRTGVESAVRLGAAIHQWSSTWATPAFTSGIDANEVHDWELVKKLAGIEPPPVVKPEPPAPVVEPPIVVQPPPPATRKRPAMFTWNHKNYDDAFLIGGSTPIRLSPRAFAACAGQGIPHVLDDDDAKMLRDVLEAAGKTEGDLTRRG